GVVLERQVLGVPDDPVDLDHGVGAHLARDLDQAGRRVEPCDPRSKLGRGDRGVAGAAADVEHVLAGTDARRLDELLAGSGDLLRDGMEVAGAPHVVAHGGYPYHNAGAHLQVSEPWIRSSPPPTCAAA